LGRQCKTIYDNNAGAMNVAAKKINDIQEYKKKDSNFSSAQQTFSFNGKNPIYAIKHHHEERNSISI
jgi:hypothetical protein